MHSSFGASARGSSASPPPRLGGHSESTPRGVGPPEAPGHGLGHEERDRNGSWIAACFDPEAFAVMPRRIR